MPRVPINGFEMYYEEQGAGAPVIFEHGYTGSHDSWKGVIERLKGRYRCIAADMRGAGDSSHPDGGYEIAQYAADVVALAGHLGLDRFTFVGHSMGGGVGMWLGLEHAARLDKLVLVAPVPASGVQTPEEMRARAIRLWEGKDRETLLRERMAFSPRSTTEDEAAAALERALSVSAGHFHDSWASMERFRVEERLGEITTPTLMIAGAADALLPANLADYQRLPNATLHVFSRVGHGIPREVPAAFSRVLADFLEHGVVVYETLVRRAQEALSQ